MSILQSKEKDGTISLRVCGYLTKDPYIPDSKKVVLFSVCHGKDKYMDCKCWADKAVGKLAACLERHDEVAVDGIYDTYTDKNGNHREQLLVDYLSVQQSAPSGGERNEEDTGESGTGDFAEEIDEGNLPF